MSSNTSRMILFVAAIATSGSLCLAQSESVSLRITAHPKTSVLVLDSSSKTLPGGLARYSAYGSITSVNGQSARGSWSATILTAQELVAGIYLETWTFDVIEADGTAAGVMTASGMFDSPGRPPLDLPIVGSTNAYFGIHGTIRPSIASRGMTNSAVPIFYGGAGELSFIVTLIPLCKPTIGMRDGLPAIAHGKDFTAVTSNAPAEPGEILSLVATDLLPELKESTTWPTDPETLTNAPVMIKIGGLTAQILYVGKYPAVRSAYQINFQVPVEVHAGTVDVQISTGYIDGQVVSIPIR